MGDDDLAPDVLALLESTLAPGAEHTAERVDGRNDKHPGQTFDYSLTRLDGQRVALEVTRAWDEQFLAKSRQEGPWDRLRGSVEIEARARGVVGRFNLNVRPADAGWPKSYNGDRIVAAVVECSQRGQGSQVVVGTGVTVTNWTVGQHDDLYVYGTYASGEYELGPEGQERFRYALESNAPKMVVAGEAGYETHLAVILWVHGSAASCRQYLDQHPPSTQHPQHIWVVDLNVRQGTQGRKPFELLYP